MSQTKEQRQAANLEYYAKSRTWANNSNCRLLEKELLLIWKHLIPDTKLSFLLGRSVQAIQIARHKMKYGKIQVDWINTK